MDADVPVLGVARPFYRVERVMAHSTSSCDVIFKLAHDRALSAIIATGGDSYATEERCGEGGRARHGDLSEMGCFSFRSKGYGDNIEWQIQCCV